VAFLAAVVAVLGILLVVLLMTCAHLLARIMRLEAAVRRPAMAAPDPGDALRTGAPLPPRVAADLALPGGGVLALHVVRAACTTCRDHLEALCRESRVNGVGHRLVIGHDADRMLLPDPCATPVEVSQSLVDAVSRAGYVLPVIVQIEGDVVVDIVSSVHHGAGGLDG
jgi:hypothetical protein